MECPTMANSIMCAAINSLCNVKCCNIFVATSCTKLYIQHIHTSTHCDDVTCIPQKQCVRVQYKALSWTNKHWVRLVWVTGVEYLGQPSRCGPTAISLKVATAIHPFTSHAQQLSTLQRFERNAVGWITHGRTHACTREIQALILVGRLLRSYKARSYCAVGVK